MEIEEIHIEIDQGMDKIIIKIGLGMNKTLEEITVEEL